MILNHLDLMVPDVAAACDFFVKYFGFTVVEKKGRDALTVLRHSGGMALVFSNLGRLEAVGYPRDFHIGFVVDTRAEVDATYEKLAADGVAAEPPKRLHGGWVFYVITPGGISAEVASYEGGG